MDFNRSILINVVYSFFERYVWKKSVLRERARAKNVETKSFTRRLTREVSPLSPQKIGKYVKIIFFYSSSLEFSSFLDPAQKISFRDCDEEEDERNFQGENKVYLWKLGSKVFPKIAEDFLLTLFLYICDRMP